MSRRPLALVSVLALGDYLLWNWSLGANHEVLALVSGLTLPPLAIVFAWLGVLAIVRLIARSTVHSRAQAAQRLQAERARADRARQAAELARHRSGDRRLGDRSLLPQILGQASGLTRGPSRL